MIGDRHCHSKEASCVRAYTFNVGNKLETLKRKTWRRCAEACYYHPNCKGWEYWREEKECFDCERTCILFKKVTETKFTHEKITGPKDCYLPRKLC